MPPPPSPWPQSPLPKSPSWPHRLRAWAAMTSVLTAPSPGLSREDSKSLSFFSQEAMRAGVRQEPECVPMSPGGLGHMKPPMGLWRPRGVPSLELAQGIQQKEPFSSSPFSLFKSGSSEAFPRGSLCCFGHLTKKTQPPGPTLSALPPAHQLTPRCPPFCLGPLSASVYWSSYTVAGTEQMTLELL